jgi:hypothetical protein
MAHSVTVNSPKQQEIASGEQHTCPPTRSASGTVVAGSARESALAMTFVLFRSRWRTPNMGNRYINQINLYQEK